MMQASALKRTKPPCSLLNTIIESLIGKVDREASPMLDIDTFRALCQKVAEEKDPSKLEILKERMKLLLAETDRDRSRYSDVYVN
jgi:hypothetical protein